MVELKEQLTKAGLTGNESKVYLELLKSIELTANELSKRISTDRTLTYTILNHLIEKGLVSYVTKENKKFFKAEDTKNLLNPLKEKEFFVKNLIEELTKIEKQVSLPYEIKVYEGKEGLRTLFNIIFENKHFLSFGGTGRAYDQIFEVQGRLKNLTKGKFSGRIILQEEYRNHEVTKQGIIKTKYFNMKAEATTTIFGDYISIHVAKEKPLIILIKNKEIAESYRNYFEVLWNQAKD